MNKQNIKRHILSSIVHQKCEWNRQSMNDIFNEYSKISHIMNNSEKQTCKVVNKPIDTLNDWIEMDKQPDSLFLIFYILQNGFEQYEFFKNKNQLIHQEKLNIIDILNNDKSVYKERIKKMKYRIQLDNIINEIAVGRHIDTNTLFSLCCIFEIPIILLYRKYYIKNRESNTYNVVDVEHLKLCLHLCKEENYTKTHIRGHGMHKPLLSMSSYKLPDILEMAFILNIDITNNGKKKTKKILYDDIRHTVM